MMNCEGSKELMIHGSTTQGYAGLRVGVNAYRAKRKAKKKAFDKTIQKVEATKIHIVSSLCNKTCTCDKTSLTNPITQKKLTSCWTSTKTNSLGVSTAGKYTITYQVVLKIGCIDTNSTTSATDTNQ